MEEKDIDVRSVNTIRVLSADQVFKANSGHPGMPMGMAPAAHVLWSRIMNYSPSNPKWVNRDRFVVSNGHGCALLYSMLHLSGFPMTLDDLKNFRQYGSKTPGHPENHMTEGVEVTTGPLGQGISNAVGMAIAQRHAETMFNKEDLEILNSHVYVFCGDGCLQEGVSSEACSLAGHLGLGNLIVIYDDNSITIDGETHLSFTEDVPMRFQAYGWHTITVEDGNSDLDAIENAIRIAQSVRDKPSLISLKTIIGYLSLVQGTHGVHGAPLKEDDMIQLREKVGFPQEAFYIPDDVRSFWSSVTSKGSEAEQKWNELLNTYTERYPEDAGELKRILIENRLPDGWKDALPTFSPESKSDATRNLSGAVLNALADVIPELLGGSADLTPSNKTQLKKSHDFQKDSYDGRYFRFGVREHGMCAIANGMASYGLIPFTASFLNFVSYAFPAVRLAALSQFQQIGIFTHDSIGLGEDGPTHQPVEILTLLRSCPNLLTFRPADGNETVGSYICAVEKRDGPSILCLSRQKLPTLDKSSAENVARGAYIVEDSKDTPELIIISTGSEVGLALDSAALMNKVRVISAPCLELFDQQPVEYRRETLPVGVPVVSIEAAGRLGWERYSHHSIAIPEWGASAPYERIYEEYGFTPEKVVASITEYLDKAERFGAFGFLPVHCD